MVNLNWNSFSNFPAFLRRVVQAHWKLLLLLLVGVCLPLLVFEQLAIVIWRDQNGFVWDVSVLQTLHEMTTPQFDQVALILTQFAGGKGATLLTIAISLILLQLRRWRSLVYALVVLIGTGFINRTAKLFWHRVRPQLWESITPHSDYSFPSGHAMASMALVSILVILLWESRWRWVTVLGGSTFVLAIGWTRMYLGVHFPSDILAGWMVSLAWAVGVSCLIKPHLTPQRVDEMTLTQDEERSLSEASHEG